MDPQFAPLFTPWKVGSLKIKNRFVMPPMDMIHANGAKFLCQLTAGPGRETPFPITSIGYIPGTPLAEKSAGNVHIIGDADKVGNLKTAILAANDLALKI